MGMSVNAPCSVCTIKRVAGCGPLPYHSPVNHSEPPELSTPMNSSTKKAGLRKTKFMSNLASAHSCARRVAASVRGAGKAPVCTAGAAVLRAAAAAAVCAGLSCAAVPEDRVSKRNSRHARANIAPATPSQMARLSNSKPASGGSCALRSAAVQYLVVMLRADRPKGSASAATVSNCGSRSRPRLTKYSTSKVTAPTYVHIIERVAVASAKKVADTTSSDGRPKTNSEYR